MNRKMIFAAVFAFAFIAAGAAFAQTADEPAQSKKAKNKSADTESETAAAKKDETTFKVGGVLEAGFDIQNRKDRGDTQNRVIGRGEVEMSARPVKKVRAEIGIEYNHRDTFIVVDKLYGQYSFADFGTVRAGLMKKSFGLEERAGVDERYFHKRSIINDNLENLGFLDHDLTLQYRHELGKEWRFAGGFSWSVKDSLCYLQNYSAHYNMMDNLTFILAGIIRHYDIPELMAKNIGVAGVSVTFVSSLSARYELPFLVSEAEFTLGTNPYIKLVEKNRDALILGARLQEQLPIETGAKSLRQVIPLAEAALYFGDYESGNFEAQLRVGLALGFAKNSAFQLRNTFGTIWDSVDGKTDVRRYRWDSEVVVVF